MVGGLTRTGVTARPPVWPRLVAIPGWRRTDRRHAPRQRVPFDRNGLVYLLREYYVKPKRDLRSCHPRDILRQLVGIASYKGISPAMSPELLDMACRTYFADI